MLLLYLVHSHTDGHWFSLIMRSSLHTDTTGAMVWRAREVHQEHEPESVLGVQVRCPWLARSTSCFQARGRLGSLPNCKRAGHETRISRLGRSTAIPTLSSRSSAAYSLTACWGFGCLRCCSAGMSPLWGASRTRSPDASADSLGAS